MTRERMLNPIITLFLAIIMFQSCNMVNPKESVPTYIEIDSVRLDPTISAVHGSLSHKITDVWVYYERQLLGAFELPARVPVITEGRGQLQVIAGIWDNGLSGTRTKYPFFTVDTFAFDAKPTETIKHVPVFKYRTTDTPKVNYFNEGFEQGNSFEKRAGSLASMVKTNNPTEVFEGDWSGKIQFDDTTNYAEVITSQEHLLTPNRDAYIEMNYKSDVSMVMRMEVYHVGTYIYSDVIGLKARDTWTKVYINMGGFASSFQYGKFKIILKATKPEDQSRPKILIDNFKVIYYN